jgi:uncharacterized protein involved in oxidation of intracellular sulfur
MNRHFETPYRAIREDQLVRGARRSSDDELTDWTLWADKVITF